MRMIKWGLVAIIALTPFFSFTSALAFYESPADIDADNYISFGYSCFDCQYSRYQAYDMELVVFPDSASAQWVQIEATISDQIIQERSISMFLVLANGKIVHYFYPQFQESTSTKIYREVYSVKPSIPELVGTDVSFQVVAVRNDKKDQYAVAWSNITPTISMKPLPVHDVIATGYLSSILSKLHEIWLLLQNLKDMLENALLELKKSVEDAYKPSPEAVANLNEAMDELMDKMPFDEMTNQMNEMNEAMQQARTTLKQPGSKLTFGPDLYMVYDFDMNGNASPVVASKISILDLTEYQEQVILFRSLVQAFLWITFFYMLFKWIAPKPRI